MGNEQRDTSYEIRDTNKKLNPNRYTLNAKRWEKTWPFNGFSSSLSDEIAQTSESKTGATLSEPLRIEGLTNSEKYDNVKCRI